MGHKWKLVINVIFQCCNYISVIFVRLIWQWHQNLQKPLVWRKLGLGQTAWPGTISLTLTRPWFVKFQRFWRFPQEVCRNQDHYPFHRVILSLVWQHSAGLDWRHTCRLTQGGASALRKYSPLLTTYLVLFTTYELGTFYLYCIQDQCENIR